MSKQGNLIQGKMKNKKNKEKSHAAKGKNNSKQTVDTDVVELTNPGTCNEHIKIMYKCMIGDSITSSISGWKMSDKLKKKSV